MYSKAVVELDGSLSSLAARKATFLLALIWIGSPVAGLYHSARRACTTRIPRPLRHTIALLGAGEEADQVAEKGFGLLRYISWSPAKVAASCLALTVLTFGLLAVAGCVAMVATPWIMPP